MDVSPSIAHETNETVSPFQNIMKGLRLDHSFMITLREELTAIVDPVNSTAIKAKNEVAELQEQVKWLQKEFQDFVFVNSNNNKKMATTADLKQKTTLIQTDINEKLTELENQLRHQNRQIFEQEQQLKQFQDVNKIYKGMQKTFNDNIARLNHANHEHRDHMRKFIQTELDGINEVSRQMLQECSGLNLRADTLEQTNKQQLADRQLLHQKVANAVLHTDTVAERLQDLLWQGHADIKRETELKMCKFTENLMIEFAYLNKRLEDQILFKIGFYQNMPVDPRKFDAFQKLEANTLPRPKSAVTRALNFDKALSQATESAGERLKQAYQQSVVYEPFGTRSDIDLEWEVARLQEGITQALRHPAPHQPQSTMRRTQFPEEPLQPSNQEVLWFQDETVRNQKQMLTLNQIWRFLSHQLDKEKVIEAKIKKLDNEDSSDDERPASRLRQTLQNKITLAKTLVQPAPTPEKPKPKADQKKTDEEPSQLKNLIAKYKQLHSELKNWQPQPPDLFVVGKCRKARNAQRSYVQDLMDNMPLILEHIQQANSLTLQVVGLVDLLEQRVTLRIQQINQQAKKIETDLNNVNVNYKRDMEASALAQKMQASEARDKLKVDLITRVYSDEYMEGVFKKLRHKVKAMITEDFDEQSPKLVQQCERQAREAVHAFKLELQQQQEKDKSVTRSDE